MEYAAGGSLHSILSSSRSRAQFPSNSRLYTAEALVAALEYLHTNRVFHRDVKPENICFWDDWENNPKLVLIDFGIASRIAEHSGRKSLTSCPGTIPYMAEECLLHAAQFTEKSEVFAVGVVLANLLTGDRSLTCLDHRATTPDEILFHADASAGDWKGGTDERLAAITCRCLARSPDERPTVSDLLASLKELRLLACNEKFLEPRVTKRIQAYNQQSRPARSNKPVGETVCVRCSLSRSRGVLCKKKHFTCSSGSCLEEAVREQLGMERFKCPALGCAKHFDPIDFYSVLDVGLYGEVILATERTKEKADSLIDLNEIIQLTFNQIVAKLDRVEVKLDSAEQKIRGEVRNLASEIASSNLLSVRDTRVDMSSLDKNLKALLAAADENNRKQERWEKDLRRLLDKHPGGDEDTESQHQAILDKLESLSLCQTAGVSLLASGRLQCPRLCLLLPFRSHRGVRSRFAMASEYQLVFLCGHDRSPVKTSVIIKQPKRWLIKAAPWIKFALFSIRVLATAYGGIPLPSLPDCVVGNSMSERMDQVIKEMESLLKPEDIRKMEEWLEDWMDSVSNQGEWIDAIAKRESEISEEAYGALVEEAYKPKNRGWMNEMEIGNKDGGVFSWVKKENLAAWKSSR
jgi:Protein kinase domain